MHNLPSAGTRSPASSSTTSPGTRSSAAISCFSPSRRTRVLTGNIPFQSSEALLGAVFLVEADRGIDHDDRQDDYRVLDVTDQRGEESGTEQDEDQDALELANKHPPRSAWRRGRKLIRPILSPALLYLLARQTDMGSHLKACGHLFSGQRMRRCHQQPGRD